MKELLIKKEGLEQGLFFYNIETNYSLYRRKIAIIRKCII